MSSQLTGARAGASGMMSPMLEAAISWASRGVSVFPCRQKKPLTSRGFKDATLDAATILHAWSEYPDAQIGIPTGEVNHLVAMDVDSTAAAKAVREMKLPATFTVQTQPGHFHLWFRQPDGVKTRNSVEKLGAKLDVRGDGGYVIAPPSIHHETGEPYRVVKDLPWAEAPAFLLQSSNGNGNGHAPELDVIPEGKRHQTLIALAGSLRARGFSRETVLAHLRITNQRCVPPKTDSELEAIANYIGTKPAGPSSAIRLEATASVELQYYHQVQREQLKWLWPGRVPAGKLTLFVGDPGTGKSLATIDLASRLSRGLPFPDGAPGQRGDVLLLTAEDSANDVVGPRLDAADADSSHIARVNAVKVTLHDGASGESMFSLERDLLKLEETLKGHGGFKLIIIDPLTAYLGTKINSWRDTDVRALLTPVTDFAARTGIAIIGIMHMRKSETDAMLRVSGSIAFVAAARAVWGFGVDPDDDAQNVMVGVKCNLAALRSALAYKITSKKDGAPYLVWQKEPRTVDAEDVLGGSKKERRAGGEKAQEAAEWLRQRLGTGPRPQEELEIEACCDAGIKVGTLRRAKNLLKVKSIKTSLAGPWYWELPKDAQAEDAQP